MTTGVGSTDSMGFSDVVVIEAGLLMETVTIELPTAVSGPTTTVNDVGDVIVQDDALI